MPECNILQSIVVSKPEVEKPHEKILVSHSGSNIEDCCELIFYIFLCLSGIALILALPICEIIIYSLHEDKCKSNDVISLSTYLLVSGVVGIITTSIGLLFSCCKSTELTDLIVIITRLFFFVWIVLGLVSLIAYNWTDECKSTHTFKMSIASLIIHLLCICINPDRKQ